MTWDPHLLGHVGSRPIFLTGSDGLLDRINAVLGPGRTWLHEPRQSSHVKPYRRSRLTTPVVAPTAYSGQRDHQQVALALLFLFLVSTSRKRTRRVAKRLGNCRLGSPIGPLPGVGWVRRPRRSPHLSLLSLSRLRFRPKESTTLKTGLNPHDFDRAINHHRPSDHLDSGVCCSPLFKQHSDRWDSCFAAPVTGDHHGRTLLAMQVAMSQGCSWPKDKAPKGVGSVYGCSRPWVLAYPVQAGDHGCTSCWLLARFNPGLWVHQLARVPKDWALANNIGLDIELGCIRF
ncbi:hypothetical protein GQ457_13G014640 [Hibiscus cannabinus]